MISELRGILTDNTKFVIKIENGKVDENASYLPPKGNTKTITRKQIEELLAQFKIADRVAGVGE